MDKFYLDIYSLPAINYQEKTLGFGHPFPVSEFNSLTEDIWCDLNNSGFRDDPSLRGMVFRIVEKEIIGNIANFTKSVETLKRLRQFELQHTRREEFVQRAGSRVLAPGYLETILRGGVPVYGGQWRKRTDTIPRRLGKKFYAMAQKDHRYGVFNPNAWTLASLKAQDKRYQHIFGSELFFHDKKTRKPENKDIVSEVSYALISVISSGTAKKYNLSQRELDQLHRLLSLIIQTAMNDLVHCLGNSRKRLGGCEEVHSGTAGNYFTRVAFEAFKSLGVKTYSYMHSGSLTHVYYRFDPRCYVEYSVPDGFYVFKEKDKNLLRTRTEKNHLKLDIRVMSNSSQRNGLVHILPSDRYKEIDGRRIKNVTFVSQLFTGDVRHFGLPDDIMSVSFEYRLFSILRKLGKSVTVKVHPKGINRNNVLVQKSFPEVEFMNSPNLASLCNSDRAEIFIVRKVDSTGFNEIVRSDKPVIIINDSGTDDLTQEAKEALKNRAHLVNSGYENGLAYIDDEQLASAFKRIYFMDNLFSDRYQV